MPRHRHSLCLLIATAIALGFGVPALGTPPRSLGDLVRSASLTPDQRQRVTSWVQYYTDRLVNADPEDGDRTIAAVEEASEKLRDPLGGVFEPSETFRLLYSNTALPQLERAMNGDNLHVAVNSLLVVSELKSPRAIDLLLDHVDSRDEPRVQIRLRAAAGVRSTLGSGKLPHGRLVNVARRIKRGAENETHEIILRYHLQAIAAAATAPDVPDDVEHELHSIWTDTLKAAIDSIAAEPAATVRLTAIQSELPTFRNVYFDMTGSERRDLGQRLGPALGKVLELPLQHDTAGPEKTRLRQTYANAVHIAQELLKIIDGEVRPSSSSPQSDLRGIIERGWDATSRQRFESEVSNWRSILSNPPYRQ